MEGGQVRGIHTAARVVGLSLCRNVYFALIKEVIPIYWGKKLEKKNQIGFYLLHYFPVVSASGPNFLSWYLSRPWSPPHSCLASALASPVPCPDLPQPNNSYPLSGGSLITGLSTAHAQ